MLMRTRSSTRKLTNIENICPNLKQENKVEEIGEELNNENFNNLPEILAKTDLKEGKSEKPIDLEDKSNNKKKEIVKVLPTNEIVDWLHEIPIFVASNSNQKPIRRDHFPKRNRDKACYLCGLSNGILEKCAASCVTRFHKGCAEKSIEGGYTIDFMKRNDKLYCSLHHCTACFADHNRMRCFNGKLIACDQCELAWHEECIPGGCEVSPKKESITCPRHIQFKDTPNLHFHHCADCQQDPEPDEKLINCTKCFRAFHFKCYAKPKYSTVKDTKEERAIAACHWCETFDFIRHGEYAMGRLANLKWYPCKVVKNELYPDRKNPFIGSVGYVCVEWLPYRGKIFHNLLSHNRVIAMAHKDYSFVRDAHKFECYDEWKLAQHHTFKNSPRKRELKEDQIPSQMMSNGEKMIRKIMHNKYSKPSLKTPRDRVFKIDVCKCMSGDNDRCGPTSQCLNRALRMECPKECNDAPNKKCNNRRISEGNNSIKVEIKYFPGKGYGAIAMEDVPPGGFVGEYVGEIIDAEEKKRRMDRIAALQSHEAQYYLMELDDRRAIDAQYYGNDMRYVNHSCNPNCIIEQIHSDFDIHLVLIAKREIQKGQELSFDYNMQGSGRAVPVCHCNEQNCTGILSADSMVKKSMYDWENSTATPNAKSEASTRMNRAMSLPPGSRVNRNKAVAVSKFSKSVPIKRKLSTKNEAKNVNKKERVKRTKTNHH